MMVPSFNRHPEAIMPTAAPVYLPAPPDMDGEQFVHGVSGKLLTVRVIGFKITGDDIEALTFPVIPDNHGWDKVKSLGNGYVTAHGRQALNSEDLSNAIRNKRPVQ